MRIFNTFETVPNMQNCRKKPIIIQARKMDVDFRVNTLEGDYAQGKAGDYLMQGIDNELYICAASIFERTYIWV